MARKPKRDLPGYGDYLQIRCGCDKLLARMDETLPEVVDGPSFVHSEAKGFNPSPGGWRRWVWPGMRPRSPSEGTRTADPHSAGTGPRVAPGAAA